MLSSSRGCDSNELVEEDCCHLCERYDESFRGAIESSIGIYPECEWEYLIKDHVKHPKHLQRDLEGMKVIIGVRGGIIEFQEEHLKLAQDGLPHDGWATGKKQKSPIHVQFPRNKC